MPELIQKFLMALDELARAGGGWREKRKFLEEACTEADMNNLTEFLSWFDTGDAP